MAATSRPSIDGEQGASLKQRRIEWERIETRARCSGDGVADRGRKRRNSGLADATGRRERLDDVDLDLRHLGKARRVVVVEIGLLDHPLVERDGVAQDR